MEGRPLYYTVAQAAEKLHASEKTVRDWLRKKKLLGRKVAGGRWLIPVDVVDRFINGEVETPPQLPDEGEQPVC